MKEEHTHRLYELILCHAEGANIKKPIEVFREVNAIEIPNNATNGDVIKAIFPDAEIYDWGAEGDYVDICGLDYEGITVCRKWWNAPYRREENVKND